MYANLSNTIREVGNHYIKILGIIQLLTYDWAYNFRFKLEMKIISPITNHKPNHIFNANSSI